jgi:hypothetical protein
VGNGIPGLTGNAGSDNPEPGWMMQHFQVVYRTAYYSPIKGASAGGSSYVAMNLPEAVHLAKVNNGSADTTADSYFSGGEAILEYYPGETLAGTVSLPNGAPVPNVRVTVDDGWGIPHMSTVTGPDGSYSLVLPPGNDTLNISTGPLNALTQSGATHIASINMTVPAEVGLSLQAPTVYQTLVVKPSGITGFVYQSVKNGTSSYVPSVDPLVSGATIVLWGHGLKTFTAVTDPSGTYSIPSLPPALYNVSLLYVGTNLSEPQATALPGKTVNETIGLPSGALVGRVTENGQAPLSSALVTARSTTGQLYSAPSGNRGNFTVSDLPAGNYTVRATIPALGLESSTVTVDIKGAGLNATQNLTLIPVVPVSITVQGPNGPMANVPVRFAQMLTPSYGPAPPVATANSTGTTQAQANSTVALTGPDGVASLRLPTGNYSVYALAFNGTSYLAGFWSGPVGPGHSALPTLTLAHAVHLTGNVSVNASAALTAPVEVAAYAPNGNVVWAFTNASRTWSLWLPSGPYTLLATEAQPDNAVLVPVDLSGPKFVPLALSLATSFREQVSSTGTGAPIDHATVTISMQPGGGLVTAYTGPDGNATLILPSSATLVRTPYCVNTSAAGYVPQSRCGVLPLTIGTLQQATLTPIDVPAQITALGLPPGTSVQVDLTAESGSAHSTSGTGIGTVYLRLAPGLYGVSARAYPTTGGTYEPAGSINWTVAVGASPATLTLRLFAQVIGHGNLTLPQGIAPGSVTVKLYSPTLNLTETAAAFDGGFLVAPGAYRLVASVAIGTAGLMAIANATVTSNGTVLPRLALNEKAVFVSGSAHLPNGAQYNGSFNASFQGPTGPIPFHVAHGAYATLLPVNATYRVPLALETAVTADNVTALLLLHLPPGYVCAVPHFSTTCDLDLLGQNVSLTVTGRLGVANAPGGLPGTVVVIGPSPLRATVSIPTAANGTFVLHLSQGDYTLYANATVGAYSMVETISIGSQNVSGLNLTLLPSWTATLTLLPPVGGTLTAPTVTFTGPSVGALSFAGQPFGVPIAYELPPGLYTANASALSSPYGVGTSAQASATLPLQRGNAAATLRLMDVFNRVGQITFYGGRNNVTLPASGGVATFGFVAKNTGNAPENLTFVGAPSTWNFTFYPRNATLGTSDSDNSVSVSLVIRVPAGVQSNHPALSIIADLTGTSTIAARAQYPPTVDILPVPGVRIGASTTVQPSVRPGVISVSLYVANSGNLDESLALSVVDGSRLASLGWTSSLQTSSSTPVGPTTSLSFGGNSTITVVLNATSGHGLPPGSVTVGARVLDASGPGVYDTVTIGIPTTNITLTYNNGTAITVTGPGIGPTPAYPDWVVPALCFVPALALVVGLISWRWYRSRRWYR